MEPVKETLATLSLSQMVSPIIGAPGLLQVIRLNSPAGTPPCDNNYKTDNIVMWYSEHTSDIASAVSGVSSEGLATTLQPAAKAADALRNSMATGKFH